MTVAEGGGGKRGKRGKGKLQWGRNLTVAEGGEGMAAVRPGIGASMGPQLDSCGRLS